ncbi:TrmH family RNA methyltransferase [Corticimicrobacter populi]|uniref:RNA methyltransferase n=1 Tax=Corticimicrobacter populi TaxID=2175229 RepID=A0A2V1K274_9BURK|nr:RNA methyltransferase [Corticimicrobacter populi]PWF25336.1 RNA methyltransferase [Corticimicrobacter populi]
MKHITSDQNPQIKQLRMLRERPARQRDRILLDGVHLCQAWLQHHGQPECAVVAQGRLEQSDIAAILALIGASRILCVPDVLFSRLSEVESHQGILFVAARPVPALPDLVSENAVWLDRIQDPGNLGTLIRTAAAAGIRRLFLSRGTASAWSPKALRAGQGGHFVVTLHEEIMPETLLPRLAVPLAATTLEQARSLYDGALPQQCVWVFGNEGQGVDPALLQAAGLRIRIPHEQDRVESLNVAVAAALCLFEQRRQHGAVG